jgi:hypothetical protein
VPFRQVLRSIFAIALAFVSLAAFRPSLARADAKVEASAKALEQKAMQEDYLATDFDKALEKLNQASGKCGTEKCSSIIRAQIKVEIGCVQIAGKQNRDAGIAAFVDALKIDSNVKPDEDLRTKDIDTAFVEAKNKLGSSGSASAAPAAGDFAIQPAPAQMVRTPLPVYAVYAGSETLTKVVVKYKAFGMTEWKSIDAKSMDKGWGAEIPCVDVQQGDLLYYVQGFNANNDPVATSGDRNNPFKTSVKRDFSGDAPHFPGKDAPKQCADAGDCPPDFPGCKKPAAGDTSGDSSLKSEGADCEDDSECESGSCKDKTCAGGAPKSKRTKFWVGVSGQMDFVLLPSANQVCLLNPTTALPMNTSGYYCTDSGGTDYPSRSDNGAQNSLIDPNKSDQVQGGFAPGNIRIMLTFDYAATANLLVGARLGYVLNTYDGTAAKNEGKTFAPIHIEARGTWVFGRDPLANAGLAPYAMLAAGVSEWDAQVAVTVAPLHPTEAGQSRTEQAWNISGPGFFSLGGGIRYAFTPRFAALFGPRFNVAFGKNATLISLSPELGLQYGF